MKKMLICLMVIFLCLTLVACAENTEVEDKANSTADGFDFSADLLPSEVSLTQIESLGYVLMASDGEQLVYKAHDQEEGVSEIIFTYIKPHPSSDNADSFITVNLKLLNPFLKGHDELQDMIYTNSLDAVDRMINNYDAISKQDQSSGNIDFEAHKSFAKVMDGVTTAESWEVDGIIYTDINNLYIVKIEAEFIPEGEITTLMQAAQTFCTHYTQNYQQKVDDYKAIAFSDDI